MSTHGSVLVVDDDLPLRELFARVLRKAGFDVEVACDGRAAIRAFEGREFSAMVTDIIMPEMEGVETIVEIKSRWPSCKIVAISGGGAVGFGGYLDLAGKLGADATIRKPVESHQLIDVVKNLIQGATSVTPHEKAA